MEERDKRAEIYKRWLGNMKGSKLISGRRDGHEMMKRTELAVVAILSLWEIADAIRELANAVRWRKWRKRHGG